MKIDSSNAATLAISRSGAARASNDNEAQDAVGAAQTAGATNAGSSTVSLSSASTLRTSNNSDIDTAKVESIKAALRDGSYKIDSASIADGMLSNARDLLQTKAR
jgi:negative regulator of flagellin synthesis FlgM